MSQTTLTIYRNDDQHELEVVVEGTYHKGQRARRDAYGLAEAPDDEPEFRDITAVVTTGSGPYEEGEVIELTPEEEQKAHEALMAAWDEDAATF